MLERTRAQSPFYTPEPEVFRDVMRRFVTREIEPYAHEWDEAGEFPRELYAKASEIGLFGLGFPEEYGGVPAEHVMQIVGSPGQTWWRRSRACRDDRGYAGAGACRGRRDQFRPDEPRHRLAADRPRCPA